MAFRAQLYYYYCLWENHPDGPHEIPKPLAHPDPCTQQTHGYHMAHCLPVFSIPVVAVWGHTGLAWFSSIFLGPRIGNDFWRMCDQWVMMFLINKWWQRVSAACRESYLSSHSLTPFQRGGSYCSWAVQLSTTLRNVSLLSLWCGFWSSNSSHLDCTANSRTCWAILLTAISRTFHHPSQKLYPWCRLTL